MSISIPGSKPFHLFYLLLLFVGITDSQLLQAQDNERNKVGELSMELSSVKWNDNFVEHDSSFVFHLTPGENTVMIYKNEKLAYLVFFVYKRTSSKINLSTRTIVEMPNGDRFYSKFVKQNHDLNKSEGSPLLGNSDAVVTYNKQMMSTVQAAFTFTLY